MRLHVSSESPPRDLEELQIFSCYLQYIYVYKYIYIRMHVCVYTYGNQILSQFEGHVSFALGLKIPNSDATQNK